MKTLEWLFQHANKNLTPLEWSSLLEVRILDDDGWRDSSQLGPKSFFQPIGLVEFVERLKPCTIEQKL